MKTVQAIYCKRFNFSNFPHKFQITHRIKKFNKDTETLIKSTKKGQLSMSDRKLTARLPENVNAVRDSVPHIPKKSIRRCCQVLDLSCSSFHRIAKNDFQLYPYRIQINKLSHKMKWQNVLRCAGRSKARLKKCRLFFRMCGWVMKPLQSSLIVEQMTKKEIKKSVGELQRASQETQIYICCHCWLRFKFISVNRKYW